MMVTIVGLVTAALGAILGWYGQSYWASRSHQLNATVFASDWLRDLRAWASDAIDVLSEAAHATGGQSDKTATDEEAYARCRHRLWSLTDRGRFFLPNDGHEEIGTEKPLAFRGIRHVALDCLVEAENVLANPNSKLRKFRSRRAKIIHLKRVFVSESQEILDPRAQNQYVAKLLAENRVSSNTKKTEIGEHDLA